MVICGQEKMLKWIPTPTYVREVNVGSVYMKPPERWIQTGPSCVPKGACHNQLNCVKSTEFSRSGTGTNIMSVPFVLTYVAYTYLYYKYTI